MTNRCVAPIALAIVAVTLPVATQNYSPWTTPENLGALVNTAAAEGCPFIAKNDLSLFVVTTRPDGFGGQDIYVAERDSALDPWGPLQNLGPAINSAGNDLCPTVAPDGHHLFFVSDRTGGCGQQDLYVSWRQNKRDDFGWEAPHNLGCSVNSAGNDFTPTLFGDDISARSVLYFGSDRPGGAGGVDIYSSVADTDDTFSAAFIVHELSTPFVDERPNIRRDGLEIFFDSNRPGTLGGPDLWVSTRQSTDAPWSPPVNLGPGVNSIAAETRPSLSFDGTTLYFGSSRIGGFGSSDIYVTTRDRLRGPE